VNRTTFSQSIPAPLIIPNHAPGVVHHVEASR
jgi:hypothetical protein